MSVVPEKTDSPRVHPNFVIAGAPKCGTTSLATYLGAHSNVFMAVPKEPNFFCEDFPNTREIRTADGYRALFDKVTRENKAVGEASTWYLYSQVAARRMHQWNPAMRVIVMVRNPVELVHSLHAQFVYNQIETETDFGTAWGLQDSRADRPFMQYARIGHLAAQLARLTEFFPRNQVKVVVFDDLIRSPGATYQDVLAFLDVPDDGRTSFPALNQSKRLRSSRLARVIRKTPSWLTVPVRLGKRVLGVERLGVLDDS